MPPMTSSDSLKHVTSTLWSLIEARKAEILLNNNKAHINKVLKRKGERGMWSLGGWAQLM